MYTNIFCSTPQNNIYFSTYQHKYNTALIVTFTSMNFLQNLEQWKERKKPNTKTVSLRFLDLSIDCSLIKIVSCKLCLNIFFPPRTCHTLSVNICSRHKCESPDLDFGLAISRPRPMTDCASSKNEGVQIHLKIDHILL